MLFIDLDDFKVVNDTLGYAAGDALLVAVTRADRGARPRRRPVARLGGDEFAILTDDMPDLASRARWPTGWSASCGSRIVLERPRSPSPRRIGIASATRRRRQRRRPRAQRRRRDVRGEGRRQGRVRDLRPGDARARPRAATSSAPSSSGRRARPARAALPADRGPADRRDGRVRGARPLAPPGARADRPGRVHRDRRGDTARSCRSAAGSCARPAPGRGAGPRKARRPADCSSGSTSRPARSSRRTSSRASARRSTTTASTPSALVIEITETALLRATPATIAALDRAEPRSGCGSSSTTSGTGYFSLSHLRQFPVDALKIAREFTQEIDDDTTAHVRPRAARRRDGAVAGYRDRRRGDRDRRPGRLDALARLHVRAGLLLQPAAVRNRSRGRLRERNSSRRSRLRSPYRAPQTRAPSGPSGAVRIAGTSPAA